MHKYFQEYFGIALLF